MSYDPTKTWIGVDFDGCLAHYDHWQGPEHAGAPIVAMVNRVRSWLVAGQRVKIFTARVSKAVYPDQVAASRAAIEAFCLTHFGTKLEVTCEKDQHCLQLWDDIAIAIVKNEGHPVCFNGKSFINSLLNHTPDAGVERLKSAFEDAKSITPDE